MIEIAGHFFSSLLVFTIFAIFHSVTAQEWFKDFLARLTGPFFVTYFWRFFYCCLSFYLLYHVANPIIWGQHPEFNELLWTYPGWLQKVMKGLNLLGFLVVYSAFLQSDYLEFWGLKQMARGIRQWLTKSPQLSEEKIFGRDRMVIVGIYHYIRHPMLTGGFLLVATESLTVNNLIFTSLFLLYLVIGVYYEEKRLIKNFGAEYLAYQSKVGGFIPKMIKIHDA